MSTVLRIALCTHIAFGCFYAPGAAVAYQEKNDAQTSCTEQLESRESDASIVAVECTVMPCVLDAGTPVQLPCDDAVASISTVISTPPATTALPMPPPEDALSLGLSRPPEVQGFLTTIDPVILNA